MLQFRKALPIEAPEILALYQSAVGSPFCVWNAHYPGMQEIRQDLAAGGLYVLTSGEGILGALSVVPEAELDGLPGWGCLDGSQREIARVVVAKSAHGRGLALEMVHQICPILRSQGCRAIHLSVEQNHLPALKTYRRAGFTTVGEAQLYGNRYYLMERML